MSIVLKIWKRLVVTFFSMSVALFLYLVATVVIVLIWRLSVKDAGNSKYFLFFGCLDLNGARQRSSGFIKLMIETICTRRNRDHLFTTK
ncbi:hypothetical protein V6N11_006748 [Hibiscus sabdariffa]|uniref:Uncharacterized protein n=1 Tax=Hibiscus sabdariffa TaxID=183260 RepID=A0ABR2RS49_9ROSI